jgi:alkanesulfonate monooxygenase SsuD/methylene tetrahydromethanopterin reductase-like flavin-dependent oxidoreductase (luciferase family)
MEFGIQFFPDIGPKVKAADAYFHECLKLVDMVDELNYAHVRTVEHYFEDYGGYSPNPILFLTAAAMRCKRARLITGAVLPVFNHPLKIAGEAGMLDAISGGRLELGFARAFLPHEFSRFGISPDESRDRFTEGLEQVRLLLEEENVSHTGRFHRFSTLTSLPRPTQQPRPPFWVAAISTPQSFIDAGKAGHSVMAIPMGGGRMKELIDAPGYDKIIAGLGAETFESQVQKGAAWVGAPDEIADHIAAYDKLVGGFEIASLQVNFNTIPVEAAQRSMRLFSEKVMPRFAKASRAA